MCKSKPRLGLTLRWPLCQRHCPPTSSCFLHPRVLSRSLVGAMMRSWIQLQAAVNGTSVARMCPHPHCAHTHPQCWTSPLTCASLSLAHSRRWIWLRQGCVGCEARGVHPIPATHAHARARSHAHTELSTSRRHSVSLTPARRTRTRLHSRPAPVATPFLPDRRRKKALPTYFFTLISSPPQASLRSCQCLSTHPLACSFQVGQRTMPMLVNTAGHVGRWAGILGEQTEPDHSDPAASFAQLMHSHLLG